MSRICTCREAGLTVSAPEIWLLVGYTAEMLMARLGPEVSTTISTEGLTTAHVSADVARHQRRQIWIWSGAGGQARKGQRCINCCLYCWCGAPSCEATQVP